MEKQLEDLKRQLEERKREIPDLEREASECKKICQCMEEEARLEMERLEPKVYVLTIADELVDVDSDLEEAILNSCKYSDKSFHTLRLPNCVQEEYDAELERSGVDVDSSVCMDHLRSFLANVSNLQETPATFTPMGPVYKPDQIGIYNYRRKRFSLIPLGHAISKKANSVVAPPSSQSKESPSTADNDSLSVEAPNDSPQLDMLDPVSDDPQSEEVLDPADDSLQQLTIPETVNDPLQSSEVPESISDPVQSSEIPVNNPHSSNASYPSDHDLHSSNTPNSTDSRLSNTSEPTHNPQPSTHPSPTNPPQPPTSDNLDFISLSPPRADLYAETVSLLDLSRSRAAHIRRALSLPVPALHANVAAALQMAKSRLERDPTDSLLWILFLKLFLALGVDLRNALSLSQWQNSTLFPSSYSRRERMFTRRSSNSSSSRCNPRGSLLLCPSRTFLCVSTLPR